MTKRTSLQLLRKVSSEIQSKDEFYSLLALTIVYVIIFFISDSLKFPVRKDEVHFWPTTVLFSKSLFPSLELLKTYGELNTPLPFIIFGFFERLFNGGIFVGRFINFVLSYIIMAVILLREKEHKKTSFLAVLSILIFPYYIGCSVHLYTDIIASFFSLLGIMLYSRNRYILGCLAFILAVSSRQYMVAFPAALFLSEMFQTKGNLFKEIFRWASLLLAILSLFGWFLLFGGFGPQNEVMRQNISTAGFNRFFPEHCLYFFSSLGIYFVIPETILFGNFSFLKGILSRKGAFLSIVLFILFVIFPPLQNTDYFMPTMGYFDKAVRTFMPDMLRMFLFYVLALVTCLRFSKINLSFWLLFVNSLLMMKSHIAWEKYIMPLLIVLWYVKVCEQEDAEDDVDDSL
jgi:hypothetical protein